MIGTSWRRPQGLGDPLMSRVMIALGMNSVPLYENAPPERIRYSKIWQDAGEFRDGPVNPDRVEIDDVEEMTQTIKEKALALGATLVGVAELQPSFIDLDVDLPHKNVFAIVVEEKFEEVMKGSKAVEIEAHRSYAAVAEIATEVARHIRNLGYPALAHHNGGTNVMAIPILYHAGFGELGKHGSLINPSLGAGFRPSFVTTDLPLVPDHPQEFGVQDTCMKCNVCTLNCPGDAIPADYIETDGVKRWLTNIEKCYPYSRYTDTYCHLCVDVCPYNAASHKDLFKQFIKARKEEGFGKPKHGEQVELTEDEKELALKIYGGDRRKSKIGMEDRKLT